MTLLAILNTFTSHSRVSSYLLLCCSRNSAFVTNPMSDMPSPQDTVFEGATLAVSNLYSKTHGVGPKHNVPLSPYLRQLSRQMLIKHGQLTLLQHIGQGGLYMIVYVYRVTVVFTAPSIIVGEFGIVYKAKLTHRMETSTVAVKTLKGKLCIHSGLIMKG